MKYNRTKKNKKVQTKVMTIPKLRKAFEQIDYKTKHILSKHPVNEESIKEFQTSWKQVFGKDVDTKTAEAYLRLQSKANKHTKGTRKTRKQKGGMAPLDYTTRPGIEGTHGTFLPYISSGFKFYNDINNIAMDADCGKQDITPVVSADMGSNKVHSGGRLIPSTSPPSILQDTTDMLMGRPLGQSPDPTQTYYKGKA
jgi:hypothetical protein